MLRMLEILGQGVPNLYCHRIMGSLLPLHEAILTDMLFKVAFRWLKASKTLADPTTPIYPPLSMMADLNSAQDGPLSYHDDYYIPGGDMHFLVSTVMNGHGLILTSLDLDRSSEPVSGFTRT